ncbi:MAG TPA: pseudouridine synthase [Roseiflexaceae bacterium]|nr:pseudouridine synthase [Roseiflexaceae bacterium]
MSAERLQKVLASAGIASRRDCEELISAGRVSVNGKVVHVAGTRVDPEQDEIVVDGRPIGQISPRTYVMLHKPAGVVSTADDPQGRPTVVEMVDLPQRLFPVGRLDYDSEGLLLMTDDGELTQRLTHPSYQIEKEYRALLDQAPSPDAIREWRSGVLLEGVPTAPAWVDVLERGEDGVWVRVVLHEGRKRQIREVAKLLGYEVLRLIRVREGPIVLGDLPVGEWRPLTDEQVEVLWSHVGGRDAEAPASDARPATAMAVGDTAEAGATRRRRERPSVGGARRTARPSAATEAPDPTVSAEGEPPPRRAARPTAADRPAPRRAAQSNEDRGPSRDDAPRRDDRGSDNRGPRRDDRSFDNRGPRQDNRSFDNRGPRRDDRPFDNRGPRRDDRPFDNRGPRRDDRSFDNRGPRREDNRGAPRDSYNRDRSRPEQPDYNDSPRADNRPEPGNERLPERNYREEKRGPGREWHERSAQEKRDRPAMRVSRPRFGDRSGATKRVGFPFRPRPPRDDEDKR